MQIFRNELWPVMRVKCIEVSLKAEFEMDSEMNFCVFMGIGKHSVALSRMWRPCSWPFVIFRLYLNHFGGRHLQMLGAVLNSLSLSLFKFVLFHTVLTVWWRWYFLCCVLYLYTCLFLLPSYHSHILPFCSCSSLLSTPAHAAHNFSSVLRFDGW